MICTTLILWYLHVNDVQNEKQGKSERLTWDVLGALSGCLWMFWVSKRDRTMVVFFDSKRRNKRFCFGFAKVFPVSSSLFLTILSLKASPLNVWWSKVFIDGFVVVLGGKQNGFKPFWYTVPLLFSHSFRMPIWCKYVVWESASVDRVNNNLERCGSWLQDCAIAGQHVT